MLIAWPSVRFVSPRAINAVDTLKMEIIHRCLRAIVRVSGRVYEIYIDTVEIIESLLGGFEFGACAGCGKMGRVLVTDILNYDSQRTYF